MLMKYESLVEMGSPYYIDSDASVGPKDRPHT